MWILVSKSEEAEHNILSSEKALSLVNWGVINKQSLR